MTNDDYVCEAVKQANGFSYGLYGLIYWMDTGYTQWATSGQLGLDALAAQLERQLDELNDFAIHSEPGKVIICRIDWTENGHPVHTTEHVEEGPDRTMNKLKAIIDSNVLKQ